MSAWPAAATGATLDLDPSAVTWERLVFRAVDRADDLSVEVRLSEVTAKDLAAALVPASEGQEAPSEEKALRMTSSIDVYFTGRAYQTDIWFRAAGLAPLQRQRDKTGDEANRKVFRYMADGVRRLRIRPDGRAEADLTPEHWTEVKEHFFPYGRAREGCAALSDPSLLFLAAAAGLAGEAAPTSLCVFNKKTVYPVRLTVRSGGRLAADYREQGAAGAKRVTGRTDVRRVAIQALDPKGGGDVEPFEFFEMSGDIEIDVAADSGLPLRIAGDVSGFGRVEFVLSEAELRN